MMTVPSSVTLGLEKMVLFEILPILSQHCHKYIILRSFLRLQAHSLDPIGIDISLIISSRITQYTYLIKSSFGSIDFCSGIEISCRFDDGNPCIHKF